MNVGVYKDEQRIGQAAASVFAAQVISKPDSVLGLATGSSPIPVYNCLIEMYKKGIIDFSKVTTFNLDEYIGLTHEHPQSYYYFMQKNLFCGININEDAVHVPCGTAEDIDSEGVNYDKMIDAAGGIDVQILGIGNNGHIAFNEPGSSLTSRTRMKTLTLDTKIANSRFFGGDINQVPETALTVGVGTIMSAKSVLIIVNGYNKARALQQGVEGAVSQMWTITALQLHEKAIIVADEAATMELKVGTYKYFKDIEGKNLDPDTLLK